jgi:hypothetical protein
VTPGTLACEGWLPSNGRLARKGLTFTLGIGMKKVSSRRESALKQDVCLSLRVRVRISSKRLL